MATLFKSKAAASLNKGHPTTFYSSDKPNPVLQALDQERNKFMSYMRKRNNPDYEVPDGEPWSRPADILFELWNKYEPRLPKPHCKEKMLEMGDFLASIGEYKLALWQCYERCLQHYGPVSVEEICNVDLFQSIFFPGGFEAEDACFTFRALLGKSISMYQVVRLSDPKLQSKQSVDHCVHILHFLRLVMQVLLPRESLCWLLFNGTVHIYNISRHLMSLGHSTKVLEYFLWAAMCMETSVPLMTVKYLSWRATLYTAVCQCYYDCKAGQQAEVFARRALSKLNELSQLESLSNSVETPQREYAFRQATVRMAVMIFKRSVFETRRKPKGLLRPKTRSNLKDAVNESENNVKKGGKKEKGETQDDKQLPITDMPWPRTPTEKMLVDMFEGGSAQFLAILESLSDSNRRILLSSPPTQDNEPEILDVFVELFIAAQEILAGGGGNKATGNKTQMQLGAPPLSAVVLHHSLIDMATRGEDGVPLEAAIRLVKLAYNYELWDTFDALLDPLLEQIKEKNDTELTWEEKSLELLQAMIQLTGSRRLNKRSGNLTNIEDSEEVVEVTSTSAHAFTPFTGANQSGIGQDDLTYLADVLISIVKGPFQQENIEIDMVVDATLYLWSKSKSVFQKFQTGSVDNPRYLHKIDNLQKWMKLLDSVHQALGWTGISSVDPCLTAEVALRLAMVYESFAILETSEDLKKESKTTVSDADNVEGGGEGVGGPSSLLSPSAKQAMVQYLCQARDILALGLENVNNARQAVSLNDGRSIADVSWIKELFPKVFQSDPSQEEEYGSDHPDELASLNSCTQVHSSTKGAAANVLNTVKDLHLEMIMTYHRITIRLAAFTPQVESNKAQSQRKSNLSKVTSKNKDQGRCVETFEDLVARCRCNKLSKALLYMQRASMLGCDNVPSDQQKTLLDNAKKLIQKAQVEEQKTYKENTGIDDRSPVECSVPPPPILLCRTNRTMVFCPAPFQPVSGQKVAWYRLFGRNAAGSNIKARMNDNFLPGTGDEVTSCGGICELKVSGLTPDECYVFAVAAYAADGTLIGDSIGATTAPILASHPLAYSHNLGLPVSDLLSGRVLLCCSTRPVKSCGIIF
ncbi:cilia- and flagella-associated protein 54-like isoform X1 [Pomacea canaliculata]|uniref:cilia- and flagella-associated protein 54-like isoform X1 n=1 Tax=Pomacea canaliculata TaxID=400727 RepID=UPI000D726F0C|nr:cilia- and flagella-associated protein 54-like isoform X1 [Pomacea canaliculata]